MYPTLLKLFGRTVAADGAAGANATHAVAAAVVRASAAAAAVLVRDIDDPFD